MLYLINDKLSRITNVRLSCVKIFVDSIDTFTLKIVHSVHNSKSSDTIRETSSFVHSFEDNLQKLSPYQITPCICFTIYLYNTYIILNTQAKIFYITNKIPI